MPHHQLKIWPEHFEAISKGDKLAEFRRDDRTPRFEKGDSIHLREGNPATKKYTGRGAMVTITHVARGGVIPEGFAMLSIGVDWA